MGPREHLNAYLRAVKNKPFVWGQHDCLTFTNDAFTAMYGKGWADDWLNRYMVNERPMRRNELMREFRCSNFNRAVDKRLQRVGCVPPLGALVTTKKARKWVTGSAMGIYAGTKCAFLDKVGVIYLPLDDIDGAWINT